MLETTRGETNGKNMRVKKEIKDINYEDPRNQKYDERDNGKEKGHEKGKVYEDTRGCVIAEILCISYKEEKRRKEKRRFFSVRK